MLEYWFSCKGKLLSIVIVKVSFSFHARTKHINVQFHFVFYMMKYEKVKMDKVVTLVNVANALRSLDSVLILWALGP